MKPDDTGSTLRVGKYLISSEVNGPGRRFVIWLQGCEFRCLDCFNDEFHDPSRGKPYKTTELALLIAEAGEIEGITLSGGEPLLQAQSLIPLLLWVKNAGLSIVCYTGWTMDELLNGSVPYGRELVDLCDILIDGRFDKSMRSPLLWRGSHNQQVHFLSGRYRREYAGLANQAQKQRTEILVGNGNVSMTGIFAADLWERLQKKLLTRSQL
jgi:anaerobic ribonucleoside-triphosphate reductase activating protein